MSADFECLEQKQEHLFVGVGVGVWLRMSVSSHCGSAKYATRDTVGLLDFIF